MNIEQWAFYSGLLSLWHWASAYIVFCTGTWHCHCQAGFNNLGLWRLATKFRSLASSSMNNNQYIYFYYRFDWGGWLQENKQRLGIFRKDQCHDEWENLSGLDFRFTSLARLQQPPRKLLQEPGWRALTLVLYHWPIQKMGTLLNSRLW